jgi:hypothetical protein
MTNLRTAAQRLLDAIDRALPEAPLCSAFDVVADTADDLRKALAYREDKAQAAFERWLVEKLLTVTQAQMAHAEAVENLTVKESLTVEPCNKSCAPGYCYCEPIIQPEIKVDNAEPVAYACFKNGELQTELVGTEADVDFWCSSDEPEMQGMVKGALYTAPPREWQSLTDDERDYYKAVGVKAVEEKLRAKNSTLACIPAVPPG